MAIHQVRILFVLFAISGFTGLIYESVWSHYLKLFLGSAAFAQSFVLAVFMGGMAIGAWIASRKSARSRNLLAIYGWIEALIGLAAMVFHEVYIALTDASLNQVVPLLGSPTAVEVFKYSLCGILILPQTILLGMTFPLMSSAVIRRSPQISGHHLSMLYFTNSIGAAAGALVAAFLLLEWLGMPGTMRTAGAINLVLACAIFFIARHTEPQSVPYESDSASGLEKILLTRLILAGAFVTGASSFIYEITWIRMLSLVLGSSFQAFELMLSAFITGLALGGLWMRRRIDSIADPVRFAGIIQFAMGLAALATLFVYHRSFEWMAWALSVLQRSDSAYPVFNVFSHAISFAVMLPATFLAGMTLPLFTHMLLRSGHGERAIGQVYASNTLGAIAGVLMAVHLLVPDFGIKLTLVLGAALDVLLGAYFLRYSLAAYRRAHAYIAIIVGLGMAAATARAEVLTSERLSSGVYRHGRVESGSAVTYYRDGKTASVAIRRNSSIISITTNGKPDASIELDPAKPAVSDEYTMVLIGALPLLLKPEAKTFANIGFGSGLTVEALLSHSGPGNVDTIEIEPVMAAAARSFFPRVSHPFRDTRHWVYFEDAKNYFARHQRQYDVIISEPSNPWVNGTASLFTKEFYRDTKRYLAPGGLFMQWLHAYEFNNQLLVSILAALDENFSDYEAYEANTGDIIIAAVTHGQVPKLSMLPERETAFLEQLKRVGISKIEDVSVRSMGRKKLLSRLPRAMSAPANSDFYPFVQLESERARFRGEAAFALLEVSTSQLPIVEMLGDGHVHWLANPAARHIPSARLRAQSLALQLARGLLNNQAGDLPAMDEAETLETAVALRVPGTLCGPAPSQTAIDQLHRAAELTLNHLPPDLRKALWQEAAWLRCGTAGLQSAQVRARLALYSAISTRDPKAMLHQSRALLESESGDDTKWRQYLLTSALLAVRVMGDNAETDRLWKKYGSALFAQNVPPRISLLLNSR